MMLPESWVKSLFARLQVRYGDAWTRKWAGLDMAAVEADWAQELGGFSKNPDAIKRALEQLPAEWPPTVAQFKALCIGREGDIEQEQPRLPAPPADPARVAELIAKIPRLQAKRSPRQWADDLRKREQAIDRTMSVTQRAAWRVALREVEEPVVNMSFSLIDPACLPPGMRRQS